MLDLAKCVVVVIAAITRLPERLLERIEADTRLLGLKIEGNKIKSKCYIEGPT